MDFQSKTVLEVIRNGLKRGVCLIWKTDGKGQVERRKRRRPILRPAPGLCEASIVLNVLFSSNSILLLYKRIQNKLITTIEYVNIFLKTLQLQH